MPRPGRRRYPETRAGGGGGELAPISFRTRAAARAGPRRPAQRIELATALVVRDTTAAAPPT